MLRIIHDNKMKNNDNVVWAWCQFKTWKLMKYEILTMMKIKSNYPRHLIHIIFKLWTCSWSKLAYEIDLWLLCLWLSIETRFNGVKCCRLLCKCVMNSWNDWISCKDKNNFKTTRRDIDLRRSLSKYYKKATKE